MNTLRLAGGLFLAMAALSPAVAQDAVFIIRHAEKAAGDDPPLTDAGRQRAAGWAEILREAGPDVIIHTDALRSRETARIVADALSIERHEVTLGDTAGVIDLIEFDHAEDRVLVVAHTETIPGLLDTLGAEGGTDVATDDFGSLFVVLFAGGQALPAVRLRTP